MSQKQDLWSLLSQLWIHVSRKRRTQLAALGGLMLAGTVAEIVSLGMVVPFLGALTAPDRLFNHPWAAPLIAGLGLTESRQLLLPLTVMFALAALIAGVTRVALIWVQARLGNAIGVDISVDAYRRTLFQPYAVHTLRNSSEVVAAQVTKVNAVVYSIVVPVLTLVTSAFVVMVVMSLMIWVEPLLTLAIFVGLGGLYLVVAQASKKHLYKDSQRVAAEQNQLTKIVQEGLGGIRDVLIDGLQQTWIRIYHRADTRLRRALANIAILGGAPRPIIEAIGVVLIGWLAYSVSIRPEGIATAIPVLGGLALAAQRLLPLVQQAYSSWASIVGSQDSLHDVLKLLEQPLPAHSSAPPPVPMPFREHISLHDVWFRHGPQAPWILSGINAQIPRGSRVGIIGTTGSGKSTVLDILMGLLDPVSGALHVDGAVVDETNRRSWQLHVAHVPQHIYLADTSIAENIAFGVPPETIDRARVYEAARKAQIGATIESWQDGYDTFVGERGIRLSGGQRQRIGIARALYKKSDVIILDEATSALDSETEQAVMEMIDSSAGELTLIIVAHRLTTLRNCTQIIELDRGMISRIGMYKQIVEQVL